jgi:hypothetical protein
VAGPCRDGGGILGSISGALLGLALGAALDVPLGPLALAALIGCGGGLAVALPASLVPAARISHLAPPTVLAAE